MADADRLLATARHAQAGCAADSPDRDRIVAAAQLLGPLLHQDVDRPATGVRLKQGVSRDRIVSVHDPEMRHGRKSSSQRFDGHKAAVAVDPESQLITAVAVLPGNAPDAQGALQLGAQSEQHTGLPVTAAMADTAYGDGHTRQQFADAGRTLIAKVRKPPARPHFPKEDFQIDLAAGTCTCPAGQVTRTVRRHGFYATATGAQAPRRSFHFDAALCTACPLRPRVWPRHRAAGAKSVCTRRKPCCRPPAPSSRVRLSHPIATSAKPWSTAWPAWCNWVCARPGTWGVTRPPPSSISPPPSPT